MPREVEREQVIDKLLVVHGAAAFRIARRDQAAHEVVGLAVDLALVAKLAQQLHHDAAQAVSTARGSSNIPGLGTQRGMFSDA